MAAMLATTTMSLIKTGPADAAEHSGIGLILKFTDKDTFGCSITSTFIG